MIWTLRLQWQRVTYITRMTHFTTLHTSDNACSLRTATSSRTKDQRKYCGTCSRCFRSEEFFQNLLTLNMKGKPVCQWRQVNRNCSFTVTGDSRQKCFKRLCKYCNKKQQSGHFYNVAPLKPSKLTNWFCIFSLIRSAHTTFKSMAGRLSLFRNTYVLSRCVHNVKR